MFQPGNLISLELKNFQNYKYAKFDFHKSLNFIAGPNGSGKSSIANAIAFIFGGNPKTIGKGKEIREYVKFGELNGHVIATIQDVDRQIVVKRLLNANMKTTLWFLNNEKVKAADVDKIYKRLKIDINNLCNFLPQEKVIEFCRSSPEEMFDNLILMLNLTQERNSLDLLEEQREEKKSFKENLHKREKTAEKCFEVLKDDVKKVEEKIFLENELKLMEIRKDWIIYTNVENEYKDVDLTIKNTQSKLKEEEKSLSNINNEIELIESQKDTKAYTEFRNFFTSQNDNCDEFARKVSEIIVQKGKYEKMIDLENKKEEKNRESIAELQSQIKVLSERISKIIIKDLPERGDFDEKIVQFEKIMMEKRGLQREMQYESSALSEEVKKSEKIRQFIQNEDSRRLEGLKTYHKDTYNAVLWLRKNKNLFSDKIIEPAYMNLNIKNMNYGPEIETFLGFQSLSSFVCTNSDDYEKFLKMCKDENKWAINATRKFKDYVRPNEDLSKHGFEGYLIDYVEAPPEILNLLAALNQLHQVPCTKQRLDAAVVFDNSNFNRFVANNTFAELRRSRYNRNDTATIETPLKTTCSIFVNNFPDINDIEKGIYTLKTKQSENDKIYQKILQEIESIRQRVDHETRKRVEYKHEFEKVLRQEEMKEDLKRNLKQKEIQLSDAQNFKKENFTDKISKINKEIVSLKNKFINSLKNNDSKKVLKELYEIEKKFEELNIQLRSKKINKINLEKNVSLYTNSLANLKERKKLKKQEITELKKKLRVDISEEEKTKMNEFPDILKDLESKITENLAKLSFISVNDASVNEYKDQEKQLKKILKNKDILSANIQEIEEQIKTIESDFINKINSAIESINVNFSNFFKKLRGEGKIEIEKAKRVSFWKLNILVKFRQNEEFQQLKSSYQSGGEKSVSTILFLLSLIQISPSPFRLVDEINQGMDKYNERGVHNILVDLKGNTQFFIITPKIVENLNYSSNMKIIIIYPNSEKEMTKSFSDYKFALLSK